MKQIRGLILLVVVVIDLHMPLRAQHPSTLNDCSARLENDVLTIENALISRTFKWNNGNIITTSLTDKASGKKWEMNSNKPDLVFPGESATASNALFKAEVISRTAIAPEHLQAQITYSLGSLEVKRVFRIYPGCAALACDFYYRGQSTQAWLQPDMNMADRVNIEKLASGGADIKAPVIEKLELPGKHWRLSAIEFFDVTDRYNTLVTGVEALSYRPNLYRGNLLFAHDNTSDHGIFMLKEAPTSNVQLAYPGGDYQTDYGVFRMLGAGMSPSDLHPTEWRRGYGFVTGVYSGDEIKRLMALRNYQKKLRIHLPGRDEMILMNTWGDRGQDSRVREQFALAELQAGAALGITHFQLDDGWQSGRSSNSAMKGGSLSNIWDNKSYWVPDPAKFPNGLDPVVKKGKELGIEVCLWFNPSRDNSNENWEKDADAVIGLNKKYGIRTFKIDGVNLPDKLAEVNFRKFLDKVNQETSQGVVFNLDVTAGRRGGYHYFNEYGNIFLENRYTDWQNYYPYTTLRNLWMLSRYVPAQNLQIEFLNKWRNRDKYREDPFAPAHYSFEYLFAITMAAQPLAWFEGTGLPDEAVLAGSAIIKKYREIQSDFHSGSIFPIGQEPSGRSWTGFQSVQEGKGYLLVFREDNNSSKVSMKTWLPEGKKVTCTPVAGQGKAFTANIRPNGEVIFELADKNTYALYRYSIQ